jgi:Family of unknown function (DUF6352)
LTSANTDFWPASGFTALQRDADGTLRAGDDYLRLFLGRPELAPVAESCDSERALHAALLDQPQREVTPERLGRLKDADAQDNYRVFLRFRERLLNAGSLQGAYLGLFRSGQPIDIPPEFVGLLAQAIVRGLIEQPDGVDVFEARAGEMLFRPQRISVQDGRVLAGDRETLDLLHRTAGLGELGRLLMQAQVQPKALDVAVLGQDNAARYWASAAAGHHPLLLDLSHEITQDVGHGLQFTLKNARSGLPALARLLERWVAQLLGVQVGITPVPRIDDAHWRWHIGLDVDSTALLNDLYQGVEVEAERLRRLVSLFRLDFTDPAEMQPDVAGRPVYLGLAHQADGVLVLKPQNLLLNLPLRNAS